MSNSELRPGRAWTARAYGVKDQVEAAGVRLLYEYRGHPSVREPIVDGYEIVSF